MIKPCYIKTYQSGELQKRADILFDQLEECSLCPRECRINRMRTNDGFCHSFSNSIVSTYCIHYGEEPPLVGTNGVGNIFFANCNLRCVYCQNYQISQNWKDEINNEISFERLAEIMLELQGKGVTAIGLVSPVHFIPSILKSLNIAIKNGLEVPLIYNTNSYEKVETLKYLDGIIDIYLPDFKYGENDYAKKYSSAGNYYEIASKAILEMFRQIGEQSIYDVHSILKRGVIIRHLVLPNDLAATDRIFNFIKANINNKINLSIMSQYYPAFRAQGEELLDRSLRESEYNKVLLLMERYGFENGWIQEYGSRDTYRPDFSDRVNPFKKII